MKATISKVQYFLICLLSVGILSTAVAPISVGAQSADSANACGDSMFLTFPAWYNGLTKAVDDSCEIMSPSEAGGFSPFIWRIALNLVEILLNLAGYAAVAFIIYGGYKYMISAGSSDGMMAARKTILNAVVGLVISIAAIAIVNTISGSFGIGG